ncbi:unnamed protein product [Owenia fusiformis]|uniref:Guanylate cyclase domain-containing protein n=1 Tax=Owenia fusiformis TaxID=6347 RepID=A0A8S4N2M5_OWEFU|nr:unnamed protein product [Owenia fusiformis]
MASLKQFTQKMEQRSIAVLEQKVLAEALVYQMLPKPIAKRLRTKRGVGVVAEKFSSVTICFTDIADFQEISEQSTPNDLIELLNMLYLYIDARIECYDVYKVETVADHYMVASGLPKRNGDHHSEEIADMLVDLLHSMTHFEIPHLPEKRLQIRIGAHTGPAVAGVVGSRMLRYCLFGDTVNTASRMQSTSLPGRIQISAQLNTLLESFGRFVTIPRGKIEIKGKGMMETHWLISKRVSTTGSGASLPGSYYRRPNRHGNGSMRNHFSPYGERWRTFFQNKLLPDIRKKRRERMQSVIDAKQTT